MPSGTNLTTQLPKRLRMVPIRACFAEASQGTAHLGRYLPSSRSVQSQFSQAQGSDPLPYPENSLSAPLHGRKEVKC
jgi:hypothetical protein